jgi:hydroxymethylpyrimidine/phosphomethylpyrimidine kinase
VQRPAVLVIAATDSSGGAGLTRDVRVLSDFGVDALCVVTAVTAQSDKKVSAVHHVPPDVIRAQIAAAFATREIGAIKIGMLGTQATVEAVVAELSAAPGGIPIIIDPVLVSTSGGVLLDAGGRAAMTGSLFPLATLVTPNVPEAAALLGESVAVNEAKLIEQGKRLLTFGSRAILLKGGHRYASQGATAGCDDEDAVDLLISRGPVGQPSIERITSKRVVGSSRGTGCALASGIAAGLAGGKPLDEACRDAKRYVLGMLAPAY